MSSSLDSLYLLPPEVQNAILNGPALAPPRTDIIPNFEHPPNANLFAQAITTIALVLVTIVFVLRAYAKIFIVGKLQLQDCKNTRSSLFVDELMPQLPAILDLAFLAYLSYIGCCYSLYRIAAGVGFFVHQWNVLVRDVNGLTLSFQIGVNFYAAAILFVKTSILLDWLQIFAPRGTRGALFWTCHAIIWFNALFYTSIEVAGNLSCRPFNRIWDKRIPGVCFDRTPLDLTSAGVNLVCDIVILLVPQRIIWQLQLTTAKKIGVSIIFAIGLLAIASATGRLVATEQYSTSPDYTYGVSKAGLWCLGELSFAFLVLCIPNLPGIFKGPNALGRTARSILSCHLLYSKTNDVPARKNLEVDNGDYHQIESSQLSLLNLPLKQTTYQFSNSREHAHLHSPRNSGSLIIPQEGDVALIRELTTRATRLT
ncbi:hypothetical protein F4782DRAFT_545011 [Xylaria castorea]|nr:hypothetical protein F4782DRAFT_545011 [Xylaria castorea]